MSRVSISLSPSPPFPPAPPLAIFLFFLSLPFLSPFLPFLPLLLLPAPPPRPRQISLIPLMTVMAPPLGFPVPWLLPPQESVWSAVALGTFSRRTWVAASVLFHRAGRNEGKKFACHTHINNIIPSQVKNIRKLHLKSHHIHITILHFILRLYYKLQYCIPLCNLAFWTFSHVIK